MFLLRRQQIKIFINKKNNTRIIKKNNNNKYYLNYIIGKKLMATTSSNNNNNVDEFVPAILLTTTETENEAIKISNILVEAKLAACVQIKSVKSLYMWESKMESSEEFQLTIKCCLNQFSTLEEVIKKNHSYDCPQIVSYKIDKCSNDYLEFMKNNIKLS
jgi:periplasmic divalent cation tolerance protein